MVALNIKCDKLWRRTLVRRLAQLVAKTFSQGVIYERVAWLRRFLLLAFSTKVRRASPDSYFFIFINRQHLEPIPQQQTALALCHLLICLIF
jgi:hypothetical protein